MLMHTNVATNVRLFISQFNGPYITSIVGILPSIRDTQI